MTEKERLELLLKKLREVQRPDLSVKSQIHSIAELLKKFK